MKLVSSEAEFVARYNIAFRFTDTVYGLISRVFKLRAKILFQINRFNFFRTRIFLQPIVRTKYLHLTNQRFKKPLVRLSVNKSFKEITAVSIGDLSFIFGIHPDVIDIINQSTNAYSLPYFGTLNDFLIKSVRSSILPIMPKGGSIRYYLEMSMDSERSKDFPLLSVDSFKKTAVGSYQLSPTSLHALKLSDIAKQSILDMRQFQTSISSSLFIVNIHGKHVNSIKKNKAYQATKIKQYVQSYRKGYLLNDNNYSATSDRNTLDWNPRKSSIFPSDKRIALPIYNFLPLDLFRSLNIVPFDIHLLSNVFLRSRFQTVLQYLRNRSSNGILQAEQLEVPSHQRIIIETDRIQRSMARKWYNIIQYPSSVELHAWLNQPFSLVDSKFFKSHIGRRIFESIENKYSRSKSPVPTSLYSNSWTISDLMDSSKHFSDPSYKQYRTNEFSYNSDKYQLRAELVDLNKTIYDQASSEVLDMDFESSSMLFAADSAIIGNIRDAIISKSEFFDSTMLGEFSNTYKHAIINQSAQNRTFAETTFLELLVKELKRYGY